MRPLPHPAAVPIGWADLPPSVRTVWDDIVSRREDFCPGLRPEAPFEPLLYTWDEGGRTTVAFVMPDPGGEWHHPPTWYHVLGTDRVTHPIPISNRMWLMAQDPRW